MKLKIGDHVRVTEAYPAHHLLRWHTGCVRTMKRSHKNDVMGVVRAITIDFDEDPNPGPGGLVFYDYELEKI